MDQAALVTEQTDAGAELVRQFNNVYRVSAAFWVKDSEEGLWYLYIASDQINDQNLVVAYQEILQLTAGIPTMYLDPFLVKLIPSTNPRAQAALEIHRRFPGRLATRFGGANFGGTGVEGAYIYPNSVTLTP